MCVRVGHLLEPRDGYPTEDKPVRYPVKLELGRILKYWHVPIRNIVNVIPLLRNPFLQKFPKSRSPHATESPPHLFGFGIHSAMLPSVLDRARKSRVNGVTDMGMRICHIVVFCTRVTQSDTWRACLYPLDRMVNSNNDLNTSLQVSSLP